MEVVNSDIYVDGASNDYAAHADSGSTNVIRIHHSIIDGDFLTDGVMSVVAAGSSTFEGSASGSGGETCSYVHDDQFNAVASNCN